MIHDRQRSCEAIVPAISASAPAIEQLGHELGELGQLEGFLEKRPIGKTQRLCFATAARDQHHPAGLVGSELEELTAMASTP